MKSIKTYSYLIIFLFNFFDFFIIKPLIASNVYAFTNYFSNLNKQLSREELLADSKFNFQIVTVLGKGKSKEDAARNAISNALLIASPRYIQKRRVNLYSQMLINEELDYDIKDNFIDSNYAFNKGRIVSFNLISTSIDNNIYSVLANVKIRKTNNNINYHPSEQNQIKPNNEIDKLKVFKVGIGFTEKEAINNAIEQALIYVVGEKINVQTNYDLIEQLSFIVKGELEKSELYTKEIIRDLTSGYSEGYVESFKKLNTFNENGFIKVEADIVIRKKSFSSYIDEISNNLKIDLE